MPCSIKHTTDIYRLLLLFSHQVLSHSLRPHRLYHLRGSSVHGIFPARILEWAAVSFAYPSLSLKKGFTMFASNPCPLFFKKQFSLGHFRSTVQSSFPVCSKVSQLGVHTSPSCWTSSPSRSPQCAK